MKKVGILCALMVLTLVFTGCGNNEGNNSGNSIVENITEKKTFARGEWNEKTYTSEFADVEVAVPSDWVIATDEEIATLMGLGQDELTGGNEVANKILETKNVYDAMAQNIYTGSNIIVMYENLALSVGGASIDEKSYLNILKTQLSSTDQANYKVGDVEEVTIGDNTYYMLPTELSSSLKQAYYVRRVGDYMACVLTTTVGDEDLQSMIK